MPDVMSEEQWEARIRRLEKSPDIMDRITAQKMRESHAKLAELNGGVHPPMTFQSEDESRKLQARRELAEIEQEEAEQTKRKRELLAILEGGM